MKMRVRVLQASSIGALLLWMAIPVAAQTTINFDDVPEGTNIDNYYLPQGVAFSCSWGIECVEGFVTAMVADSPVVPSSPPNIVTTSYDLQFQGCFDDETAIVRATFTDPVDFASIVALNQSEFDNAFLAAYAMDGTQLDFDGRVAFTGGSVLLTVSAPDIAYVEFSGWQFDSACFDDLTFAQGVSTLPPFGLILITLILLAAGVLVLKRVRRSAE